MKNSDELELEYQLRRRNNPGESEEVSRKEIYKLAMQSMADSEIEFECEECGVVNTTFANTFRRDIR